MDITHNEINNAILNMELLVAKGQPFAKANKERQIRAVLRDMRKQQGISPTVRDIWAYIKIWVISKLKGLDRRFKGRKH